MTCGNISIGFFACALSASGCASSSPDTLALAATGGATTGGSGGVSSPGSAGSGTSGGQSAASGSSGSGGSSEAAGAASSAGAESATSGAAGTGPPGAAGSGGVAGAGQAGGSASEPCENGAVFCEDFEGLPDMAAPTGRWASRTSGIATVTVDTQHAHSGMKAVHFHSASQNGSQRAYILTQNVPGFPIASDVVYVRFMLYIGRYIIPPGSTAHNRIAWLGGRSILEAGGGAGPGYLFSTYNGIAIERLEKNQGFQRDTTQHMEEASRVGKWQCFEFSIDNKGGVPPGEKSDSTTTAHIWQDGVALKLSAGGSIESWLAAPFEALQFSLWCPQTDPQPTDYWIDDVAVSTQRVNCPSP